MAVSETVVRDVIESIADAAPNPPTERLHRPERV
jgi:hypothetical protein